MNGGRLVEVTAEGSRSELTTKPRRPAFRSGLREQFTSPADETSMRTRANCLEGFLNPHSEIRNQKDPLPQVPTIL